MILQATLVEMVIDFLRYHGHATMQTLQAYQWEMNMHVVVFYVYVHLVQRALFAYMTFQASLVKMRRL